MATGQNSTQSVNQVIEVQDTDVLVGTRPRINLIGATIVDDPLNDRVNITVGGGGPAPGGVPNGLDAGQAGSAGVSLAYAREDHDHAVPAGTPADTADANAEGVAVTFARSDHVHRTIVGVQDSGAVVGSRPALNFIGAGVSAVDDAGNDRVNILLTNAATWADTLVLGNVSGGTNPTITSGDVIQGEDSAVAAGGPNAIRGGDHTGGGATDDAGGSLTVRAGDTNATGAASVGGILTVRAGNGAVTGGALTVLSGTGVFSGAAEFGAGDLIASSNTGASAEFHGSDTVTGSILANSEGGFALFRGGDAPAAGAVQNANGGNANIRGGNFRTGIAGAVATAGGVFVRSGQLDAAAGSIAGATGDIRITTNADATVGDMPSISGAETDTGSIQIDTVGVGVNANTSGSILIATGDVNGLTGNSPGDITVLCGSMLQTGQSFAGAASFGVVAGDSAGAASSPAGSIGFSAGTQTATGTQTNSPGGSVSINAGDSAKNNATSGGGSVLATAGTAVTGVNSPGGDITLQAGGAVTATLVGDINAFAEERGAFKVRTQDVSFAGTENAHQTFHVASVVVPTTGPVDICTLGTIDTDGRHLKFQVEVSAVDTTDDTAVSSTVIFQSARRDGGAVTVQAANLGTPDKSGNLVATTFASDIDFTIFASGDDLLLRATNTPGNADRTGRVTVRWYRQEGGFA